VWVELFGETKDAAFAEEESFVAGDRGVLRWVFTWTDDDGSPGHVRGVDVLRFRDGLVAEKLSYVKG
jgi:ketosteroid isomerase-like protein